EGGVGGRTAAAAPPGPDGGAPRLGSILGARVLAPPGPLNATSRGVILSMRQPLTASPSVNLNGLAPLTAKIAILRPGSVTIPVRRVSARSEVFPLSLAAVCGGRRELLNSGRPRTVARSSSCCALCWRRTAGGILDRRES